MLIAFYILVTNFITQKVNIFFVSSMFEPTMIILIVLAGIVMMLGSVGMKVSNNLGATLVIVVAGAIGYVIRTLVQAIGWIFRTTVRMTPRVYYKSRDFFLSRGINSSISNILAIITSMGFVALIL